MRKWVRERLSNQSLFLQKKRGKRLDADASYLYQPENCETFCWELMKGVNTKERQENPSSRGMNSKVIDEKQCDTRRKSQFQRQGKRNRGNRDWEEEARRQTP
ncbi:hypothetical protein NPIL_618061 [Nephila pilipes]|uniref:Uncharacterized protein n=1 Tax=Nephila pilipes TaxID=299642 RepID=A0A8X6T405_NEPPI|nr:hypothetical protein NPIL_618061 [Nephila pilipes]